jgi:hypothetical protein
VPSHWNSLACAVTPRRQSSSDVTGVVTPEYIFREMVRHPNRRVATARQVHHSSWGAGALPKSWYLLKLKPKLGGWVFPEQGAVADVAAEHGERTVAGLAHKGEFPRSIQVPLGHQAGAKRMPGVQSGVEPGCLGGALDDQPHRIFVQTSGAEMGVPVDAPK